MSHLGFSLFSQGSAKMRARARDPRPTDLGQGWVLMQLENRLTPNSSYHPPSHFLFDLQEPGATQIGQSPLESAVAFLEARRGDFGLHRLDLSDVKVTSQYRDTDRGTSHLYLRQMHN